MANMCEAVERMLLRHASKLREAAGLVSEAMRFEAQPAGSPTEVDALASTEPRLKAWQRQGIERRAARLALYEEAVRRRKQGESIKAIARAMKLSYPTVRKFVFASAYPERAQRPAYPTLLDEHRAYLVSRAAEGCCNATQIWRELREQGFTGSPSTVRNAFARVQAAGADSPKLRVIAAAVHTMGVPSTRRACAWLLGSKGSKSASPSLRIASASSKRSAASSLRSKRRAVSRSGSSASFTVTTLPASTSGFLGYALAQRPNCVASQPV